MYLSKSSTIPAKTMSTIVSCTKISRSEISSRKISLSASVSAVKVNLPKTSSTIILPKKLSSSKICQRKILDTKNSLGSLHATRILANQVSISSIQPLKKLSSMMIEQRKMSTHKSSSSAMPSTGILANEVTSSKRLPPKKLPCVKIQQYKMQPIKNKAISAVPSSSKIISKRMNSKKMSAVKSSQSCHREMILTSPHFNFIDLPYDHELIFSDRKTTKLYRGFMTYFQRVRAPIYSFHFIAI
ncbi:hypothetical protein ACKWTF_008851 [Chironomus riparius]